MAQAERYITQELKEYEEKILGADEKILSLETKLFGELIIAMQEYISQIQINANVIAHPIVCCPCQDFGRKTIIYVPKSSPMMCLTSIRDGIR